MIIMSYIPNAWWGKVTPIIALHFNKGKLQLKCRLGICKKNASNEIRSKIKCKYKIYRNLDIAKHIEISVDNQRAKKPDQLFERQVKDHHGHKAPGIPKTMRHITLTDRHYNLDILKTHTHTHTLVQINARER